MDNVRTFHFVRVSHERRTFHNPFPLTDERLTPHAGARFGVFPWEANNSDWPFSSDWATLVHKEKENQTEVLMPGGLPRPIHPSASRALACLAFAPKGRLNI